MTETTIDLLGTYPFSNSVTVTGDFSALRLTNKMAIKDCNFNFNGDLFKLKGIDGMFDGCRNATFSSDLMVESGTITSASYAFRDCEHAKIPKVDIHLSDIVNCEHMFENCYTAELEGVSIPSGAHRFNAMFKNAKSALFVDIGKIPHGAVTDSGLYDYSELFCGCEEGIFTNLSFSEPDGIALDCGFMFYYCRNMNCGDLKLDHVSNYIKNGDYMFYGAGMDGSNMMDGQIFTFSMLSGCDSMFSGSNFAFNDSFFIFDRGSLGGDSYTGTVSSLYRAFADCSYGNGRTPVIVLGQPYGDMSSVSAMDESLNNRLDNGYYENAIDKAITDFGGVFSGSSFKTLDLRGICNNPQLSVKQSPIKQNFADMCKGCDKLESIVGFLPAHASSYASMFEGCRNLSVDLSKLFTKQYTNWHNMDDIEVAYDGDDAYDHYTVSDIRHMFDGCGELYSTSDAFDLIGLFKTVRSNNDTTEAAIDSVSDAFPPIRLATHDRIPGIFGSIYDISDVSSRSGTVKFNSVHAEPFETETDGGFSEYGLYSQYAKKAFSHGYCRYGGRLPSDTDKCFFIMYYPEFSEDGQTVMEFKSRKAPSNIRLVPDRWGSTFSTDSSQPTWNDFSVKAAYAGFICDLSGNFIRYAYIGNYTRTQHDRKRNGDNVFVVDSVFEMPVTYFDGGESNIEPLL